MLHVDASHVATASQPFAAYCNILTSALEGKRTSTVVETGIVNKGIATSQKQEKHWNAERKSTYIISTAQTNES
jgi:hypothetical protein